MKVNMTKKQKWISGLVGGGLVCVVALSVAIATAPKEKESASTQSTEQVTPKKKTDDSSLSKKEKKKVEEIIKKGDNKLGSTTSGLLGDNYSRSVSTIKDTPVDQVIATKKSSEKKETLVAVASPVEQPKQQESENQGKKPVPDQPTKPENPTQPDKPVEPTPPVDPVEPDYTQLIAQVNGNADTVKSQANAINTALESVKNEMNNLNTVSETSSSGVKTAKEQADKMQKLTDQYNELSKQIKQFIDKNGEIDLLHLDEYKTLYTQLDSVVNELKETNQSMKKVADKVSRSLSEAKQTAASIDTVKETVAQQKANQAVVESNASQTNNTVATYPAIADSVAEKVTDMNNSVAESANTGTAVDQELATYEANKEQQQSILDQAQADSDTIQELGKSADEQVQQTESDFSSLPKVPQSEPTNEGVTTNETTNSTI